MSARFRCFSTAFHSAGAAQPSGLRLLNLLIGALLCLAAPAWALDVNRATLAELQSLKGVGPKLAARIEAERERAPFADFADLMRRVKGVGPARVRAWRAAGATIQTARGKLAGPGRSPSAGVELIQGGVRAAR